MWLNCLKMFKVQLENNLIYPNDVRLLFRAFHKMKLWAIHAQRPYWWNHKEIKQLWRE